jgi:hypothetical protein
MSGFTICGSKRNPPSSSVLSSQWGCGSADDFFADFALVIQRGTCAKYLKFEKVMQAPLEGFGRRGGSH